MRWLKAGKVDDSQVLQIAKEVRREFASVCKFGDCIPATDQLFKNLRFAGIDSSLMEGYFLTDQYFEGSSEGSSNRWEHSWIEIDGKVLDITASQFNEFLYKGNKLPDIFYGYDDRYIDGVVIRDKQTPWT